ncbi:MAG: GNAT superfamily N-acetyltransferase [Rhodothermales bacterium]|jgi:GNAT superfamily N-acetyltransferase
MAGFSVRPVRGRRERAAFIDFQFRLYKDDPFWVPQLRMDIKKLLNPKKNAFFEHGKMELFLAWDEDGRVVGRIAAIVNGMHLKKYDDNLGFFGFFETVDQQDVVDGLLTAADGWLRAGGMTAMRGPVNPSLNDTAGLLVNGFESAPFVLMTHNPAYYQERLAEAGFQREMTLWAYYIHQKYAKLDKVRRGVSLVRRRNPLLTLRSLNMKRFKEEAATIRDIFNDGWQDNWGHVPMTEAEFDHLALEMKQVVDPRMAYILEMDGEPIAFAILIPNMNQALAKVRNGRLFPFGLLKMLPRIFFGGIQEVRLPLMGIKKAYQGRGFDALMILEIVDRVPPLGYPACEMSWILDNNMPMRNALESLGGTPHKEYAILERPIGPASS